MKRYVFLFGFAGLFLGPIAFNASAYFEDKSLKAQNTPECAAFAEIDVPDSIFIFKRHTQEDTAVFSQLRVNCEKSILRSI